MDFDIIAKLIAPLFTAIIGFVAKQYIEFKPNLVIYLLHTSAIPLKDEKNEKGITVNTHSVVVRNIGKKTAHNVRIGHAHLPKAYQLFPQLIHKVEQGLDDSSEIILPTLVPGEQVTISYLYFPPDTYNIVNSYCKSDEVSAKTLSMIPAPQLGKFQLAVFWLLIFIGASTVVYFTVLLFLNWLGVL